MPQCGMRQQVSLLQYANLTLVCFMGLVVLDRILTVGLIVIKIELKLKNLNNSVFNFKQKIWRTT